MAGELIKSWGAGTLQRDTSTGYNPWSYLVAIAGSIRGLAFPKNAITAPPVYTDVIKIPGNATLTTGVKFDLVCTDDGKNANDLGLVAVLGVTVKKLVSGTDTFDVTASGGAEVTANVTLAATTNVATILTISVPTASLDSAAAGDTIVVRFRRVGSNASDTLKGRVVVASITAYAY
jgi:hypothetical protein